MYADADDVKAAIGTNRLATFVPSNDDDAAINSAIMGAQGEMDVYFAELYDVPLNYAGLSTEQIEILAEVLKRWCVSIALFMLIPQGSSGVPKGIQISYDRVMSRLRDLKLGKYELPYIRARVTPAFLVAGDEKNTLTPELFDAARIF